MVGIDSAVLDKRVFHILRRDSSLHPKFIHSLGKNLLVCLVTHICNIAALLCTQKISGTTDIQILHCNIEPASEIREFLDSLQTPPRILRKSRQRRHDKIAESLLVRPSDPSPQLMQFTQTEILSLIYDDCIGIGNVKAAFNDSGAQQQIVVTLYEIEHLLLQFLRRHLSVRHTNLHIRDYPVKDIIHGRQFMHLVVKEENLPSAIQFIIYDIPYFFFIEKNNLRLHRNPVRRGSTDDGKIPRLQRPRNRCRGQCQCIDRKFQLAQLLLRADAEFLLLINDKKAQILEFERTAQYLMGSYQYIYLSFPEFFLNIRNLLRSPQTAHVIHIARKILEPGLECIVVLESKNGSRHEHHNLLAVRYSLECSPHRKFRLAEPHITAYQPVHRTAVLHIPLYGLGSCLLVRGIFIHKTGLQFLLKISIGRKRKAGSSLPLSIQTYQFLRDILDLGLGIVLQCLPCL